MNINECYEYIQMVANKEQGGFISPDDFNTAMDAAQMEFFNDRYGQPATYQPGRPIPTVGYPQSQKVHDDISVLMEFERIYDTSINPYKDLKNGEYLHFVGAYYIKNTGYQGHPIHTERYPLDFKEYDEYNFNRRSTMFDTFDKDRPCVVFNDEKFFFFGVDLDDSANPYNSGYSQSNINNGDELYFVYLRRPRKPIWNYMYDEDNRPVYSEKLGVIPVKQIGHDLSVFGSVKVTSGTTGDVQDEVISDVSSSSIFPDVKYHDHKQQAITIPDDGINYNIYPLDLNPLFFNQDKRIRYNPSAGNLDSLGYIHTPGVIIEFCLEVYDSPTTIMESGSDNYLLVIDGASIDYYGVDYNQQGGGGTPYLFVNGEKSYIEKDGPGKDFRVTNYTTTQSPGDGFLDLQRNTIGKTRYKIVYENKYKFNAAYRIKSASDVGVMRITDLKRYTTGSVDLELPQQTHLEICYRALGYLGINLSEAQLVQYAEGKQTQTPGV